MLEIKTTVTEMKDASDGLISTPDMAEETISELEAIAIEATKAEKQGGKKKWGKKTHPRISRTVRQ